MPAAVRALGEATPRPTPAAAVAGLRAADGLKRAGHRVRRELASGHDRVAAVGGNDPVVRAAAGMLHHAVRAAHAQLIDQRRDGVLRGHQRVHRIGRRAAGRGPAGRAPPVGCEGSQQAAPAEDVAAAQRCRLLGDLLEAERALQLLARLRFIKQLPVLEHLHRLRRRGRRAGRGIRFQLQPRALGARHVRPAASGLGRPLAAEPGQRPPDLRLVYQARDLQLGEVVALGKVEQHEAVDLGETGPLSLGGQAGRKALKIRHVNAM